VAVGVMMMGWGLKKAQQAIIKHDFHRPQSIDPEGILVF
jgi:hypothetical protein